MIFDSFSSQTWAILVPKRNSDDKSIVWPTGPPHVRSQNKGYWEYLIKIKENNGILPKFGTNLLNFWLTIVFIKLLCYKSLKNCHKYGSKHIWKPSNLNWRNECQANIEIFSISLILTSHWGWPCRPHYWLILRVPFRYQNRPCLGRKWVICNQYLWNTSPWKRLLQKGTFRGTPCSKS